MSTLVGGAAPTTPIKRNFQLVEVLQSNAVLGETRRFKQIERYQAFYDTTQYNHLKLDWWGMNADNLETVSPEILVPNGFTQPAMSMSVRGKRPTAPYHLCKAVVDRFTGLLFGETRKPKLTVEGDPDTEQFLLAAMEQMRFTAKMREARTIGGSCGSVLVTAHVREGKFSLEVHNPKHLQIMWKDRRTFTPAAVLKSYRYPVEVDHYDKQGNVDGTEIVDFLYRRIITSEHDIVYKPVQLTDDASFEWEVEDQVEHNLGFFPGVWIQNLPVTESEDGHPDCHGSWQNFDTMDRIISQINQAILANLDPTLVLGVDPKVMASQGGSVRTGSAGALNVGPGGTANFLEITGSGVKAGQEFFDRLKQNTLDVVRCVMVDPQTISGAAQSAKAIEYIYAPMLEKSDDLRAQYGDLGMIPLLLIVEKMARHLLGQEFPLEPDAATGAPRVLKNAFKLPPRKLPDGTMGQQTLGPGGYLALQWGPYFQPTVDDDQKVIGNIVAAKAGGLIDQETAVKSAAPVFDVRDVAGMEARIAEQQKAEMDSMTGGGFGGMDAPL
jgi:hypothetical protein